MTPRGRANYVAKLRVNVLRAKGLKPLGHIFDFATLRIKCCRQHLMPEMSTSGSMSGVWKRGMVRIVRHRQPKGSAPARLNLHHRVTPRLYLARAHYGPR